MSKVLAGILCTLSGFSLGPAAVHAGVAPDCAPGNGDVNGDGKIDLGDPITILGHLFLGGPTELLPFCAPPGPSAKLPATGQTKCHDADGAEVPCDSATCPGQDGAYGLGCPIDGRFVDGGDGTVLDGLREHARRNRLPAPQIPARAPRPFHRPGWVYEEKVDGSACWP